MHFKKSWLLIVGLTGLVRPALADWQPVGGSLNTNQTHFAHEPSVAFSGTTPYVAWSEDDGTGVSNQVFVRFYNGSAWQQVGTFLNLNSSQNALDPSLAIYNTTPYVAWEEYNGSNYLVYSRFYNGSSWQAMGSYLNLNATRWAVWPSVAFSNTTPYVAFSESNDAGLNNCQVYLKYFNSGLWFQVGSYLDVNVNAGAMIPSLAFSNTTPYVGWMEYDLYVKYYSGGLWHQVGTSMNRYSYLTHSWPNLALSGTTPYMSFMEEGDIIVCRYNGTDWEQTGSSLNRNGSQANTPWISVSGTTPYVAWQEYNGSRYQIYSSFYNGLAWQSLGGSLNVNKNADAAPAAFQSEPVLSLAFSGTTPYVAWTEANGVANQVYVKNYNSIDGTPTATFTVSKTPTFSPTRTRTFTMTSTPSRTSTMTASPTPSPSFTPSPTQTLFLSPTASPSQTSTSSSTSTRTISPTQTVSPTVTDTPTSSPTRTPYLSPTLTPTPTNNPWLIPEGDGSLVSTYPSPLSGDKLYFQYFIPEAGRIVITLYNLAGEKIGSLEDHHPQAGRFTSVFAVRSLAPGVYLYRFQTKTDTGLESSLPLKKFVVQGH